MRDLLHGYDGNMEATECEVFIFPKVNYQTVLGGRSWSEVSFWTREPIAGKDSSTAGHNQRQSAKSCPIFCFGVPPTHEQWGLALEQWRLALKRVSTMLEIVAWRIRRYWGQNAGLDVCSH